MLLINLPNVFLYLLFIGADNQKIQNPQIL